MLQRQQYLLLFFLSGIIIIAGTAWFFVSRPTQVPAIPIVNTQTVPRAGIRPTYTLDSIMGAETTLAQAQLLHAKTIEQDPSLSVKMMVVPHHAYVVDEINEAWERLRAGSRPSVIVLVGPNHDDLGVENIQTTDGSWQTPWGRVETDARLVNIVEAAGAAKTTEVFSHDHSIGVHIPYVAALFPDAKLAPITFRHQTTAREVNAMLDKLVPALPADAVIVYSIDFSHYLTSAQARIKDIDTYQWMTADPVDTVTIDAAGADHFDSHASINMFLASAKRFGCNAHVTWHGNSGEIASDPVGQTTSYFVWMCDDVPRDSLVIHAGGDLQFDRGIAPMFRKIGIKNAMLDVGVAMTGADIRFANLESVISDKGADSGKEISFRASLDTFAALTFANFSALSVSNNHTVDWGRAAWQDSYNRLVAAHIIPVGNFFNTDAKPVISEIDGKKVAFLGFDEVDRVISNEIVSAAVKEAAGQAPFVIVSFHWGVEYKHYPTPRMEDLAHAAIDAGADVVLGGHPHVLQGFEVYKEKLIAYSLGNLVFDQLRDGTHQSMVIRIVIDQNGKGSLELVPMQIDDGWVNRYAVPAVRRKTISDLASWSFGALTEDLKDGRGRW